MRPRTMHRHRNLERLIKEAGSVSRLARLVGTSSSYLSQVRHRTVTPSGQPRGVGDRLASKLEAGMGKPAGWLDEPHGEAAPEQSADSPSSEGADVPQQPLSFPGPGALVHDRGRLCPLVSWVQAGGWSEVIDLISGEDPTLLICPVSCGANTFALRVRGVSMLPEFEEGDVIFVDPDRSADANSYVVVCTESTGEATFKRLVHEGGLNFLQSLNPDWPDRIIAVPPDARICGVVVYKGREL